MKLLSIDIGTKNCAFYIEEFDENLLNKTTTLEELYQIGNRVYLKVVNFEHDLSCKDNKGDIFTAIISYLDSNLYLWDRCNGIIIERQMKLNYNAQIIQHFIFAYFKIKYGNFKYIADISATRKTQCLNAPKKLNKPERKKWAVKEANKIFEYRNDFEGIGLLSVSKADDLADSILQLKAFQKCLFIDKIVP